MKRFLVILTLLLAGCTTAEEPDQTTTPNMIELAEIDQLSGLFKIEKIASTCGEEPELLLFMKPWNRPGQPLVTSVPVDDLLWFTSEESGGLWPVGRSAAQCRFQIRPDQLVCVRDGTVIIPDQPSIRYYLESCGE